MHPTLADATQPTWHPLFDVPVIRADESPLNDLDDAEHDTDDLPDETQLIESLEQADEEWPTISDPGQPEPGAL